MSFLFNWQIQYWITQYKQPPVSSGSIQLCFSEMLLHSKKVNPEGRREFFFFFNVFLLSVRSLVNPFYSGECHREDSLSPLDTTWSGFDTQLCKLISSSVWELWWDNKTTIPKILLNSYCEIGFFIYWNNFVCDFKIFFSSSPLPSLVLRPLLSPPHHTLSLF